MPGPDGLTVEYLPIHVEPAKTFRENLAASGAWISLLLVDLLMRSVGFDRFHRLVRTWPTCGRQSGDSDAVQRTCAAVDRAATYYFRRAWCLQRSATTVLLLRLRGIAAELVIGARKLPFAAHAWVEVGGRVANNSPVVKELYTVLERC